MAYDPDGKIRRIPNGALLPPGSCCSCGTVSGDVFADLGLSVEWFGALYLCESCALGACEVFGGLRPANEDALRKHIRDLLADNEKLVEDLDRIGKLNESLRTSFDDLSSRYWKPDDDASSSDDEQAVVKTSGGVKLINSEPIPEPDDKPEDASESDDGFDASGFKFDSDSDEDDSDDPLATVREALAVAARSTGESTAVERPTSRPNDGRLFGE